MAISKKKIISVFGTRPEAIKMAPLVKEIEKNEYMESVLVVTAQHREMLDQVLELFDLKPDYDLDIMKANQSLTDITANVLQGLDKIFAKEKPDMVLVHGDTSTTFTASLAAYYKQIPLGHVEAGLRSGDLYSPFPEEGNRILTGHLASWHFSPTKRAKENLLRENIAEDKIFITGNTVIDALMETVAKIEEKKFTENTNFPCSTIAEDDKIILVTAHRRENHGKPLKDIFKALLDIHRDFPDVKIVFPVHRNPKVKELADQMLGGKERIILTEPLEYEEFSYLMNKAFLILTDSGGIQEEAPALGKPVLVLRENTERPEAVEAGTVQLLGTDSIIIYESVKKLLTEKESYDRIVRAINPYGDGKAAKRTVAALGQIFDLPGESFEEWK